MTELQLVATATTVSRSETREERALRLMRVTLRNPHMRQALADRFEHVDEVPQKALCA